MVPTTELLQVALTNVPLIPEDNQFGGDALMAIAGVTGIPLALLAQVRLKMRASGSLNALRALLCDPLVPKADGFSYMLTVEFEQSQFAMPLQQVGQTVTLQVQSRRGRMNLTMATRFGRSFGVQGERQSARVWATCTLQTPTTFRSFRHKMVMVHLLPAPQRTFAIAA